MDTADHDETVRRSFERQTGLFTGDDAVFARRSPAAPEWVGPLHPDLIALDVACGAGHVAEEIAPHVRQVVGVDMTPALLCIGAERIAGGGLGNVLLQEGDASRLAFVDGSFDLVVCRSALHHFADPAGPVAEMARVCRPGGRVVISDMVAPDAGVRSAFDALHRRIDPSHVSCLLDTELAEMVERAVGPIERRERSVRFTVPIERILTEVADRPAALEVLQAEIDGGPVTGFSPVTDPDGQLLVTFGSAVVEAARR